MIHRLRSALGEVTDLTAEPYNKPLDPSTAQIVARSIYGAGRGVLFADEVGAALV